ncbi:hypothetical protein [Streptomyces sp. Da 82-17]|uniref:hypothetical protein n=1 Tax=Streptomyces sp. Da 82-17 TaxID=3377116 RepID=UPI0038D49B4E
MLPTSQGSCRRVTMICLQTWRDVVELPPQLFGGKREFPARLGHTDVLAGLDRAGCAWEPYPPLTFSDQVSIRTVPSGALFTFACPDDEEPGAEGAGPEPVLNVMGPPADRHVCLKGRP